MNLDVVEIKAEGPYAACAFALLHAEFPEPEWEPEQQILTLVNSTSAARFFGYLEENRLVGMSYVLDYPEHPFAYVVYLGVNACDQGRGLGTAMLHHVERVANRPLALSIETTEDEDAPNLAQRQRRRRFYERCGFHDSGARIFDCGVSYIVMANAEIPVGDIDAFAADFPRLVGRP